MARAKWFETRRSATPGGRGVLMKALFPVDEPRTAAYMTYFFNCFVQIEGPKLQHILPDRK